MLRNVIVRKPSLWRGGLCAAFICAGMTCELPSVRAAQFPELIGVARVAGNLSDRSGLTGCLEEGTPQNQFGGISAIDRIGDSHEYLALSDRGPHDGAVHWVCRFHRLRIRIAAGRPVTLELLETVLLRDAQGRPLVGFSGAFAPPEDGRRFDPEGIRWLDNDRLLISDEYGPSVWEFDRQGNLQKEFSLPDYFKVSVPAPGEEESLLNQVGRQANRGLEGLAFSRKNNLILGAMQSPLIQDAIRQADGSLSGLDCRLIGFQPNGLHEWLYRLESAENKISEILAGEAGRFLVIERDGRTGSEIQFQRILEVDLQEATDVSGHRRLGDLTHPPTEVRKRVVIDFLDSRYGLAGDKLPEKIEGLCWGPRLADGRQTLIVTVDNDFVQNADTVFYVFALHP